MKSSFTIKTLIVLLICGTASAWWTGDAGTNDWFTAGNWNDASIPDTSLEYAEILNEYGIAPWPILDNGSVTVLGCQVGGLFGHPGLLEIDTGGNLDTSSLLIGLGTPTQKTPDDYDPADIGNTVEVNGGTLDVLGNMAVSWKSEGRFYQTGGAVKVGDASNNTVFVSVKDSDSEYLFEPGYMELSGGTFKALGTLFSERGKLSVGNGEVLINGGDATFGSYINVGEDTAYTDPNTAIIRVESGQLNGYKAMYVGAYGPGRFIQTGGDTNLINGFQPAISAPLHIGIGATEGVFGIAEILNGTFDCGGVFADRGSLIIDNNADVFCDFEAWFGTSTAFGRTDVSGENAPELVVNSGSLECTGNIVIAHSMDGKFEMNGGTIQVGVGGDYLASFTMGTYDGNSIGLMTGGEITADFFCVGAGYADSCTAEFEMTGGTINVPREYHPAGDFYGGYFVMGEQGESAEYPEGTVQSMDMSGGTVNTYNATIGKRGTGQLSMTGGTFNIQNTLHLADQSIDDGGYTGFCTGIIDLAGGQMNIGSGIDFNPDSSLATIDISGGVLVLDGDQTVEVQGWIDDEYLIGYGGLGAVVYDYNDTNAGKTTVTGCLVTGDISQDCKVDLEDFAILASQWQQAPGTPSADIAPPTGDGVVNIDDLQVLAESWLAP